RLVAAAVSRYVERHLVVPAPASDPEGFVAAVARLAAREHGLVCFPLEDPTLEVLSAARERLPELVLPIAPHAAIALALDKHATAGRAPAPAPRVPRGVLPAGPEDLGAARALAFPVVVKPRRGWGAQGVTVVERREELDAAPPPVAPPFPPPPLPAAAP